MLISRYISGLRSSTACSLRKMSQTVTYQCHMCGYYCPSLQLFVRHLRLVHSNDPGFMMSCGIDNCIEVYHCFASFNSHLYRNHRVALGLQLCDAQCAFPDDSGAPGPPTLSDINATPALDGSASCSAAPGLSTQSDNINSTPAPGSDDLGDQGPPTVSDDINVIAASDDLADAGLLTLSDDINATSAPVLDGSGALGPPILSDDINDLGTPGLPTLSHAINVTPALDDSASAAPGLLTLSDDINDTLSETDVDEATVGNTTVVSFAHQPELLSSRQYLHDACLHHKKENAEFLLMFTEGKQVSQVALDEIVKGCRNICEQTVSRTKERVLCVLNQAGVNVADIPGLEESLSYSSDPFESIDTAYLREKFYKTHFNFMVRLSINILLEIRQCSHDQQFLVSLALTTIT